MKQISDSGLKRGIITSKPALVMGNKPKPKKKKQKSNEKTPPDIDPLTGKPYEDLPA